jgi:hypothetical protein
MELDFMKIEGVKIINNIPHAVGADGIQKVFEAFGIKKSKKAAYKFITKAIWKKRIVENGKSKIAIPITEVQRWIKKNYPIVWQSSKDRTEDEKEIISKNFALMENFEKIIDEIKEKVETIDDSNNKETGKKKIKTTKKENESNEKSSSLLPQEDEAKDKIVKEDKIWTFFEMRDGNNQAQETEMKNPNDKNLLELVENIIDTFLKTPPSDFKTETLEELKRKLIFVLEFIENINRLKKQTQTNKD